MRRCRIGVCCANGLSAHARMGRGKVVGSRSHLLLPVFATSVFAKTRCCLPFRPLTPSSGCRLAYRPGAWLTATIGEPACTLPPKQRAAALAPGCLLTGRRLWNGHGRVWLGRPSVRMGRWSPTVAGAHNSTQRALRQPAPPGFNIMYGETPLGGTPGISLPHFTAVAHRLAPALCS